MSESSFGGAAPKSRSINVAANLLAEWTDEQARNRREKARTLAIMGVSFAALAVVAPWSFLASSAARREAHDLRRRVTDLDAALAVTDKAMRAAQPALQVQGMRERTQASFDRFVDEIDGALRAGNARTVLSVVHVDVQGGEVRMNVRAEAEEDGAADAFARNASEEGASVDAITSSRPSTVLGPQGLSFQYEKRVKVTP